jgi:hypothetical protein
VQQTDGDPVRAAQSVAHPHVVHGVAGRYATQCPAAHTWLGPQTLPQVPQKGTPASRSTHWVRPLTGHPVKPPVQAPEAHEPWHRSPLAQTVVQLPQ